MRGTRRRWLKKGTAFFAFLIEEVSLLAYLAIFAGVVLVFGGFYYVLTPYGQGVGESSQALAQMTFPLGVYFSVVTVSSLGYGDFHPMGVSKALACVEVLFGFAVMGIVIAKITSRRLSYHVQRLFGSDAQRRLEGFASQFERSEQELQDAMKSLGRVFQSTPGGLSAMPHERSAALGAFTRSLSSLDQQGGAFLEYLSYECEQGAYFDIVPADALTRVGDSIDHGVFLLGQLIISLPPEVRQEVLDTQARQRVSDFLDHQRMTCQIVHRFASDETLLGCFRRILGTCNTLPVQYFSVPVAPAELPDQRLHGSDEPDEPPSPPSYPGDDMMDTNHPEDRTESGGQ